MIDIMIKWPAGTPTKNNLKKLTTQQQNMISQAFVSYPIIFRMFGRHLVMYLQCLRSATTSKFRKSGPITITVIS